MTSKRDLGPILAIAGAVVAIIAVIAGFVVIGGPGDARERRLDEMTMQRVYTAAKMAHCAFILDGAAPAEISDARAKIAEAARANPNQTACGFFTLDSDMPGAAYSRLDESHIRVCGDFRRPYDPGSNDAIERLNSSYAEFPELLAPRPAGQHCYNIQMVASKPAPT